MQPDITFIMAAYNAGVTIERAITSALRQTGVCVQVVVVDDGSTDDTIEKAQAFGTAVRVLRQPQNGGPGAARNVAIDAADGKWIAVLDADDEILPDRSARLLSRMSSAEAIVDNLVIRRADSERMLFQEEQIRLRRLDLAYFIGHNMVFGKATNLGYSKPMIRRDFLSHHALRYDESLRIGEDYMFLAKILASGASCLVEAEAGYVYHSTSTSSSARLHRWQVEDMIAADSAFVAAYRLSEAALTAQRQRDQNLRDVLCFLDLVDDLKQRQVGRSLVKVISNPRAATFLRLPIAARANALTSVFREQFVLRRPV